MQELESILAKYNEISNKKIDIVDLIPIKEKYIFLNNKFCLDDIDKINLIDVLLDINKKEELYKIDDDLIDLVLKIVRKGNILTKDEIIYIPLWIKHLVLPFYKNNCDDEHNLSVFLGEFDLIISEISDYWNEDVKKRLNKYNQELCKIVNNYTELVNNLVNSEWYNNLSSSDNIILHSTLLHLSTMLYFYLSYFDYKYDLMNEVFSKIINNYQGYVRECLNYDIYKDIMSMQINPKNVLKEYIICYDMLKQEINPPILIKRR